MDTQLLEYAKLLTQQYPTRLFELNMLNFLTGLQSSLPRPLLSQVESGKSDSLTKKQLAAFQEIAGLQRNVST